MFKFLRDKIKSTVSKLSERIDKEAKEEVTEIEQEVKKEEVKQEQQEASSTPDKAGFFSKLKSKIFSNKDEINEDELVDITHEQQEEKIEEVEVKKKDIPEKSWVREARIKEKVDEKIKEGVAPELTDITSLYQAKQQTKQEQVKEVPVEVEEDITFDIQQKSNQEDAKKELDESPDDTYKEEEIIVKDEKSEKDVEEKEYNEKIDVKEIKKTKVSEKLSFERPDFDKERRSVDLPIEEESSSFFGKLKQSITTKKITEKQFEDLFWDLEIALLENNVAVEVIDKIKVDLKEALVNKPIPRSKITNSIYLALKQSIESLFKYPAFNLVNVSREAKPYIICFVGVNGSGKTTTIAKVAKLLKDNKLSSVIAASDTFRAAAIDQLEMHADNLGIKLVKHDYGSDPAAVAFDSISYAKAHKIDVVLIDTAGRMHSNENLMEELKKVVRVSKPHLKIFVGESITGNDCVEQAKKFNDTIGIDGIILSKADVDEKGGAAISVSYITGKPILYLGVGQEYSDLEVFKSQKIITNIGLEA